MALASPIAFGDDEAESDDLSFPPVAPDIREDETPLKVQRGDFVIVPIPFSNPTLDTGLVAGGAYFYPQTEEQAAVQPASVTAAAGMYSSSDSFMYGIAQQNYWNEDTWRFTGALGKADLRLRLSQSDEEGGSSDVDWNVAGEFLFLQLSHAFTDNWFFGVNGRFIDISQRFGDIPDSGDDETSEENRTAGLGFIFEYDIRDMPLNSYSGKYFQAKALFNDEHLGSDDTYQAYQAAYRSYHSLNDQWVLAWEAGACKKTGRVPLWDYCRIDLRGFSATDYLGRQSVHGQVEARWRMSPRWGMVGFAGAGYIVDVYDNSRERETVPSFGVGVRFTVLKAKRINMRLDYARSRNSDAIHVSVGEAF